MKKLTILSLVLAGACALPALTLADDAVPPKPPGGTDAPKAAGDAGKPAGRPGGGAGRMDPAERLKMLTEKLGLTQDQQDKIKAIYEKNAPQFKDLMAKGRENLSEDDKTKMRELFKTQTEEIAAVLTPEQKEKFKELRPGGPRKPADAAK
jgi:protein CpxP